MMGSVIRKDTPCWCNTGPSREPLPWFRLWFQQWHFAGEDQGTLMMVLVTEEGWPLMWKAEIADVTFDQPKEWKDPGEDAASLDTLKPWK